MNHKRALFVVGQQVQTTFHHRGVHFAKYLSKKFDRVDVVSITHAYDGPQTDPFFKKVYYSFKDILIKRVIVEEDGNLVNYIVPFPYRLSAVDYIFRDIWTYICVRNYLNPHYDLCVMGNPKLAFIGIWLKQFGKVDVLIYDDWDHLPSHRPGGFFWKNIMRVREFVSIRRADGVSSVSKSLLELRRKQGAKRSVFVPNGVDYNLFSKAQVRTPHPPTILFMGKLDEAWGADLPIQSISIIKDIIPNIKYILLGEGKEENNLHALVAKFGLENYVQFYGWQEYSSLPFYLAQSDIGVATYRNYQFIRFSRPLKIIEYMAAGLPVIGTRIDGEVREMIEGSGGGETINFSSKEFSKAALNMLTNHEVYKQFSDKAVTYARTMDWDSLLDQEMTFIDGIPDF